MQKSYILPWFYIYDVFQSEALFSEEGSCFYFELCFMFLLGLYFMYSSV